MNSIGILENYLHFYIRQECLLQCQTRVHLIVIKSHTHSLSINRITVFVPKINKIKATEDNMSEDWSRERYINLLNCRKNKILPQNTRKINSQVGQVYHKKLSLK